MHWEILIQSEYPTYLHLTFRKVWLLIGPYRNKSDVSCLTVIGGNAININIGYFDLAEVIRQICQTINAFGNN